MDLQRDLPTILLVTGIVMLGVFAITIVFVIWIVWRIERINLPADADLMMALRAMPLSVAVTLDLLDLSLDIFSAPVAWFLLDRLGLKPLRGIAVVKDLIPFDAVIPAMTLAWVLVRAADHYRLLS